MKRLFTAFACLILVLMFLASCSAPAATPAMPADGGRILGAIEGAALPDIAAEAAAPAAMPAEAPAVGAAPPAADFELAPLEDVAGFLPILTPSQMGGRMMSYNVTLNLQTTAFVPGLRLLLDTVGRTGGYLEYEHIRGNDMRNPPRARSANYSFRVPSERLNDFLVMVEDNFNIVKRRIVPRDDTIVYSRADTRLDDLREQEQRLIADLGRAGLTPDQRLEIERTLTRIQSQIADFTVQQMSIQHDVHFSIVTVTLYEVIFTEYIEIEEENELPPTFGDRLGDRVQRSSNALVAFFQWLLLAVIAAAPVLVVVVVLAAIALIIVRTVRKRGGVKKKTTYDVDAPDVPDSDDE